MAISTENKSTDSYRMTSLHLNMRTLSCCLLSLSALTGASSAPKHDKQDHESPIVRMLGFLLLSAELVPRANDQKVSRTALAPTLSVFLVLLAEPTNKAQLCSLYTSWACEPGG